MVSPSQVRSPGGTLRRVVLDPYVHSHRAALAGHSAVVAAISSSGACARIAGLAPVALPTPRTRVPSSGLDFRLQGVRSKADGGNGGGSGGGGADGVDFHAEGTLGSGSDAAVFSVQRLDVDLDASTATAAAASAPPAGTYAHPDVDPTFAADPTADGLLALKVNKPAYALEWYHSVAIARRLPARERRRVVRAQSLVAFDDASYVTMEQVRQGSLQDVVNVYRRQAAGGGAGVSPCVDEALALYYAIEMCRTVEVLHAAGFVHGDLKPDNWMVRSDPMAPDVTWDE